MDISQMILEGLGAQEPDLAISTFVSTQLHELTNYEPDEAYDAQNWVEVSLID